ncbi:MAG: SH3 domain-containing protein [Anaerolineae bacterium]|nr:SH3 domain-containing protein [Anaerolineae bacterium]
MRLFSPQRGLLILLAIVVAGCTLNNVPNPGQTISGEPTVRILSPQPNATYFEGVAVNIQATVANAGSDIDRVEVVIDGQTVATLTEVNPTGAASFNVTHGWSATGIGAHTIDVTAYRPDGSSSAPATVEITVVAQSGGGSPTRQPTQSPGTSQNTQTNATSTTGSTAGSTAGSTENSQSTTVPPTAAPTNAPAASATPTTPTASFAQGINVRRGPGLAFDPPIGAFAAGQTTEILALNTDGTWYKVRYGGGEGWVFAQLTQASGNVNALPRDPGPPVPTAAPPTAVPPTQVQATTAPTSSVNLVAGIVELNPGQPSCAQTFNIGFDVANLGSQATSASSTVAVQDVRTADGSVQQETLGGFPVLQAGQTFRVDMPLTVSTWYNEEHTIILVIDPSSQNGETEEGDNRREVRYTLQK